MAKSERGAGSETRSPEEFIVPARDTKGESARLWCRIQPAHDRQLDVVLSSKKFPFRSRGDIIRWALSYGLRELAKLEEGVPSMVHEIDAMNELLKSEQFRQEFIHTFTHLSTVVQQHMADNDVGEARKLVVLMRRHLARMEDGHWKKKYLRIINDKFGHIIEDSRGVKLKVLGRVPVNGQHGSNGHRPGRHIR